MKLKNVFKPGQIFVNNMGAVIIVSKISLKIINDDIEYFVEYKIASSSANLYHNMYEYKDQEEQSFWGMLKANNYKSVS